MPDWRDWTRDTAEWLPELRTAIEAVGKALRSRQPTPQLLSSLMVEYVDAIPGHKIAIERTPKGATRPRGYQYEFRISGNRVLGTWHLTNAQLRDAINAVCPDFPIRLS